MEIVAMDMKVSCHGNEGQLPLPNTKSCEGQSIICDIAVFFLVPAPRDVCSSPAQLCWCEFRHQRCPSLREVCGDV